MGASDRPRSEDHRPRDDRHLSEDVLNRYIDGDLDSTERAQAEVHLSQCAECRSELADVRMLASLLHELPQVEVPRSFQLGPEHARPASWWDRLASLLLPMLPAMRATTVALVLVLGGLTAYRVVEDQPSSGPVSELAAPVATTTAVGGGQFAGTSTPANTETPVQIAAQKAPPPTDSASRNSGNNAAADESGAGGEAPAQSEPSDAANSAGSQPSNSTELQLPGQAQPAPTESTEESAASSASDTTIMVAAEPASPTASPTATASPSPSPTASPTATPSPTVTPSPTPTIAPASTGTSDRAWLGWVQAILAAGILILGGLMIGLTRFRKPVP
ncbi:MAG TPA: zf-HC2 domain-containing protein [Thermomicrobiales bacterium]|jgi:anti-sigma factor RsiW|nr:zf-HC2 domain-containing protein [Thermomicrobiales bacterium]